jgi:hypothetical protein
MDKKCTNKTDFSTPGNSCHLEEHCEKEDHQEFTTIDDYLRSTRLVQAKVKRSTMENQIDPCALGLPDLQLTKVFSSKEKDTASDSII